MRLVYRKMTCRPLVVLAILGAALALPGEVMGQTTMASSANRKTVTIGTGSGVLNYPSAQKTLNLSPGDTLYIAAGTYEGISLGNLNGTADDHITVKCDPNARFSNSNFWNGTFPNVSFVDFQDFRFVAYGGRAFCFSGASHDVSFTNFTVNKTVNYFFYIYDSAKVFDGTKASTFYNFKWDNCVFDNIASGGAIFSEHWDGVAALTSVSLDFEISHCTIKNIDGCCIALPNSYNLKVHDCSFSDIGGTAATGHVSVIGGNGTFQIYNNIFTRHWGDDVRMFSTKLNALGYNGPDALTRYYNNISYQKRKYAAFEHNQISPADISKSRGFLSLAPSEVYFNTFYRSKKFDYVAPLVDVYAPNITIKYNLIIEPECDVPFDAKRNYVYQLGAGQQSGVVAESNLVFPTLELSGLVDAASFTPSATSPILNAATEKIQGITDDYYHKPRYRNGAADVGAVQR